MRVLFSAAVLLGALVLTPIAAAAAPIKYQIDFGPSVTEPAGGTGFFFWDDVTELLSGFSWEFAGQPGGIVDAAVNWSAPVFGGTKSTFLFEILTLQDVHPEACSGIVLGCGQNFNASELFGYPGLMMQFVNATSTNAQLYSFGPLASQGSFSVRRAQVPEPGTLALLALGIGSAFARRWRSPARAADDIEARI
jgi:hypothetical protein